MTSATFSISYRRLERPSSVNHRLSSERAICALNPDDLRGKSKAVIRALINFFILTFDKSPYLRGKSKAVIRALIKCQNEKIDGLVRLTA